MHETEETGEEKNTEEEGEVFLLGSKPEKVIREEEKELARPVRRIKNGKEISILFSPSSEQPEARCFSCALMVESCDVSTAIRS